MSQKSVPVVEGIRCSLRTSEARNGTRMVLQQIRSRFPKDYERLKARVREICPLPTEETEDGTLGEWKEIPGLEVPEDRSTWGRVEGVLYVKDGKGDHLIPTIAHELGHACTRWRDLERRGAVPFDEWRSEMTADWYAYKWGFGKQTAKARKSRAWRHHGPPPGSEVYLPDLEGREITYRVSRNFVVRASYTDDRDQVKTESSKKKK